MCAFGHLVLLGDGLHGGVTSLEQLIAFIAAGQPLLLRGVDEAGGRRAGVLGVSPQCYRGVTVVLQWC
jgi:hypothetical protein